MSRPPTSDIAITARAPSAIAVAICLLSILAMAGLLRSYQIGSECFDGDELYAVRFTTLSPQALGQLVARTAFHENHPPLELVPYLFWTSAFGAGEAAVRSLPLILGILAVLLVYHLTRRLAGPLAGLLAAAVIAINPLHVAYSQEARPYAMLVVLTLIASVLFVRCLQDGRRLHRLLYAIICIAALLTHYFAVPVLAGHLLLCLWLMWRGDALTRARARSTFLTGIISITPFVFWLPGLAYQARYVGGTHLAPATPLNMAKDLHDAAGLGTGWPGWVATVGLLGMLALAILRAATPARAASSVADTLEDDPRCPLPAPVGLAMLLMGLAVLPVVAWAIPRYLLPSAGAALEAIHYTADQIRVELNAMRVLILSATASVGAMGLLIWQWPRLLGLLARLPSRGGRPLSMRQLLIALVVLPIVVIFVLGIGISGFVTARNLLILVPPTAVAAGIGLATLAKRPAGVLVALTILITWFVAATQYDPIAAPLRLPAGQPMGYHTGPWKQLDRVLVTQHNDLPLMAAKCAFTDPILYYLHEFQPQRLTETGDRDPAIPPRFLYVYLPGDHASSLVTQRLSRLGYSITRQPAPDLDTADNFVLYLVQQPAKPAVLAGPEPAPLP